MSAYDGTGGRSYVLLGQAGEGAAGHLALALVREQRIGLVESQPRDLLDLVPELLGQVAELSALVHEQEERHDLEDALALPVEPVADVAELAQRTALRAGLLVHLAERRLLAR